MCKYCGMTYCPPACPSYTGERPAAGAVVGRCAYCEDLVRVGDRVLERDGDLLCLACAEACDEDTLLYLESAERLSELLVERLGWESRYM